MAKTKSDQSPKSVKPAKNLTKVTKNPRSNDPTKNRRIAESVTIAFQQLPRVDNQGLSLQKIKNFVKNRGFSMNEENATILKEFIANEFQHGRIVMTNGHGDKINFTKRLEMVQEAESEDLETDGTEYLETAEE